MSKTIEVVVQPDGTLKIEAVGFLGASCEKATEFLHLALGRLVGKQKKPEYYRQAQRCQQVNA